MVDDLKTALQENIVLVTFTKVDGTVRTMRATNSEKFFERKLTGKERKKNENVTYLYDLDKGSWRSMKNDNLISWEIVQ